MDENEYDPRSYGHHLKQARSLDNTLRSLGMCCRIIDVLSKLKIVDSAKYLNPDLWMYVKRHAPNNE